MKSTNTTHLSCAVFGHNLEPLARHFDSAQASNVFICSSCNAKMVMDASGDFEELPYKNNHIKTALRQLFLLNRRSCHGQLSI